MILFNIRTVFKRHIVSLSPLQLYICILDCPFQNKFNYLTTFYPYNEPWCQNGIIFILQVMKLKH